MNAKPVADVEFRTRSIAEQTNSRTNIFYFEINEISMKKI